MQVEPRWGRVHPSGHTPKQDRQAQLSTTQLERLNPHFSALLKIEVCRVTIWGRILLNITGKTAKNGAGGIAGFEPLGWATCCIFHSWSSAFDLRIPNVYYPIRYPLQYKNILHRVYAVYLDQLRQGWEQRGLTSQEWVAKLCWNS